MVDGGSGRCIDPATSESELGYLFDRFIGVNGGAKWDQRGFPARRPAKVICRLKAGRRFGIPKKETLKFKNCP